MSHKQIRTKNVENEAIVQAFGVVEAMSLEDGFERMQVRKSSKMDRVLWGVFPKESYMKTYDKKMNDEPSGGGGGARL